MKSFNSNARLDEVVKSLEDRKKKYLILKGSSILAISFLIFISLASLLSLLSSNPSYYTFLKVTGILALIIIAVRVVIIPLIRKTPREIVTSELDKLESGLAEDTLNALELKENNNFDKLGTSENLAISHIDITALRLSQHDYTRLFPIRELKKYFVPLLLLAALSSILLIFISSNFRGYLLCFDLSPRNTGSQLELADIEITLKYPEYTNLSTERISGSNGDIKAIKGTEVTFEAEPLTNFKEGILVIENGLTAAVQKSGNKIAANFTVLESGSFFIEETKTGKRSETFKIMSEGDREPLVSISSPLGNSLELGSDDKIDIFYDTQDDFGFTKLLLTWENQKGQTEANIPVEVNNKTLLQDMISWSPRGINPADGETIKLRVRAYDNDTISGPKYGVSNPITIQLQDARAKHREALAFAEQLMEELIDILADEINILNDNNFASDNKAQDEVLDLGAVLKNQKLLTQKIEHAIGSLDITLSTMAQDEYSDYTYYLGLKNMESRLRNVLDERKYLIESFAKLDTMRLERLMKKEVLEFENDILFLDSMLKGDKLIDSLYSSRDLLNEYDELSEMLKELNQNGSEELQAQIQKKLDQLKDLMSQLAQKINGLDGDLQEGFLNKDAYEAMNMQSQLDQISKLAKDGNIEQALEMLSSISQSLQNMIASLENGMQSFGSSMMAKDMSKLNDLLSKIEEIEKKETNLKEKTQELKQDILKNPDSSGQNLREFIEKERDKIEKLIANLKQTQKKILEDSSPQSSPEGAYLIEKMIEKSQQLNNWLQATDFKEASKNAKSIDESTDGLKEMSSMNFGNLGKASKEISSASKIAGEIRKDLERFDKNGNNEIKHEKMAKSQDGIKDQTGNLSAEAGELGDGFFLDPNIGDKLDRAEEFMGSASEDLREQQVSKAISNQDEAIKALQQAKKEARDMLQQMQLSAKGNGSSVPMMLGQMQNSQGMQGTDNRYVEIPKVDESLIGKEYKQRILEAMKGGSPEGYIELNKKYYDRIIK